MIYIGQDSKNNPNYFGSGKLKISKTETIFIIPKEELYSLYIIKNKTQQEIADIYKCHKGTIKRRIKKYNIKRDKK